VPAGFQPNAFDLEAAPEPVRLGHPFARRRTDHQAGLVERDHLLEPPDVARGDPVVQMEHRISCEP
jgi:hypothetical protein